MRGVAGLKDLTVPIQYLINVYFYFKVHSLCFVLRILVLFLFK